MNSKKEKIEIHVSTLKYTIQLRYNPAKYTEITGETRTDI